jgi:hypothetical protein
MGKIIIEFDSVEESQDARDALDGYKFYSNEEASSEEIEVCQKIRDEIRETLTSYNLNIES